MTKYDFVSVKDYDDQWCIMIKDGDYEGVLYKYGTIEFVEDNEVPSLKFDYNIINDHTLDEESKLNNDSSFEQVIGDILVDILMDQAGHIKQDE